MGEIILITSGKGGSGKSTFTVNCGAALALLEKKVLLIDADAGLRSLDLMLNVTDKVVYDLSDVILGRCEPVKAIVESDIPGLHMLSAPQSVFDECVTAEEMKRLCRGLAHYYDYIFIDSPAGVSGGAMVAAAGAERAIVVATPDPVCIRDADRISRILSSNEISDIRLVINRIYPKLIRRKKMPDLDAVIDGTSLQLLGVIPEDQRVAVCSSQGIPVIYHKKKAAQAYINIAKRMTGACVPLMKL